MKNMKEEQVPLSDTVRFVCVDRYLMLIKVKVGEAGKIFVVDTGLRPTMYAALKGKREPQSLQVRR